MEIVHDNKITNLNHEYPPDDRFLDTLKNGEEIRSMKIQPERYLVEGLIAERTLTVLGGEEGSGKSMLLMNLGIGLAAGIPKFLDWEINKSVKVLYLNNEMDYSSFLRRFQKMASAMNGLPLEKFSSPQRFPRFDESKNPLIEHVSSESPDLIIFDCMYLMHDLDENDASKMKSFIRDVAIFAREYNSAVIIAHHVRKGKRGDVLNSHLLRGSSAISAFADNVFILSRNNHKDTDRILSIVKTRDLPEDSRRYHRITLEEDMLWFRFINKTNYIQKEGKYSKIKPEDIFANDMVLKRSELVNRMGKKYQIKTPDKLIKQWVDCKLINNPSHGMYELVSES
jgi:RecA-family ATPase